jgi:hypothetical protein
MHHREVDFSHGRTTVYGGRRVNQIPGLVDGHCSKIRFPVKIFTRRIGWSEATQVVNTGLDGKNTLPETQNDL